jgi:hypothetical protein
MKKKKRMKVDSKKKLIKSEDLDRKFDEGSSIMEHADLDAGLFRVNVDFTAWKVSSLDKEATRLGISRQALIKVWIAERLDQSKTLKNTGT